jgi:hypothetical protein
MVIFPLRGFAQADTQMSSGWASGPATRVDAMDCVDDRLIDCPPLVDQSHSGAAVPAGHASRPASGLT